MSSVKYKLFLSLWKLIPFKKNILDILKKRGASQRIIGDLYLNDKFKVKFENLSFYLYNSQYNKSSFDIYLNGLELGWDRFSLKIWKYIAEDSRVILDVGTNIGLYCIVAKLTNENANVIGFEPSKNANKTVVKNLEINKLKVKIEQIGLSSKKGSVQFYDLNKHTAVSSIELNENLSGNKDLISYEVEIMTLDEYVLLNEIEDVDLISIDVEEHEEQVLMGMNQVLKKFKPSILIEVLNADLGTRIQSRLNEFDYSFFFVNEDGYLLVTNDLSKRPQNFSHSYNVLAVQRTEVIERITNKFDLWD